MKDLAVNDAASNSKAAPPAPAQELVRIGASSCVFDISEISALLIGREAFMQARDCLCWRLLDALLAVPASSAPPASVLLLLDLPVAESSVV